MGIPVGLNAFPLKLHRQRRGFLHRGDISILSQSVHMHKMITGLSAVVNSFSVGAAPDAALFHSYQS
jgi:hypothetical protein